MAPVNSSRPFRFFRKSLWKGNLRLPREVELDLTNLGAALVTNLDDDQDGVLSLDEFIEYAAVMVQLSDSQEHRMRIQGVGDVNQVADATCRSGKYWKINLHEFAIFDGLLMMTVGGLPIRIYHRQAAQPFVTLHHHHYITMIDLNR